MSFLAAVAEHDFAVLLTDRRAPDWEQPSGAFRDDYQKQCRVAGPGVVGFSGADTTPDGPSYATWLEGVEVAEVPERVREVHHALAGVHEDDPERPVLGFVAPDDPEAEGDPLFARFVVADVEHGLRTFSTANLEPRPVGASILLFPPGVDEEAEVRMLRAAREESRAAPSGPPRAVAALAVLGRETAMISDRVGPTVDVSVLDRRSGEVETVRGEVGELLPT